MRDDHEFTTDEPTGGEPTGGEPAPTPARRGGADVDAAAGGRREAEPTRHERVLDVPADEAWSLLGTSDGLERWLGDDVDLEIAAGEHGTIRDGDELLLTEVESVEPRRRVSLRWWSEERGAAIVDLTLEPVGDAATRLVVTEIPVEVLRVPATAATIGGGLPGGGPQMRALALA